MLFTGAVEGPEIDRVWEGRVKKNFTTLAEEKAKYLTGFCFVNQGLTPGLKLQGNALREHGKQQEA